MLTGPSPFCHFALAHAACLQSQGAFNITTNYKTEKIFRDTDFTVVYNVPCYSAEFDGIVKLFMSLPRQGRQCNEMPGWYVG